MYRESRDSSGDTEFDSRKRDRELSPSREDLLEKRRKRGDGIAKNSSNWKGSVVVSKSVFSTHMKLSPAPFVGAFLHNIELVGIYGTAIEKEFTDSLLVHQFAKASSTVTKILTLAGRWAYLRAPPDPNYAQLTRYLEQGPLVGCIANPQVLKPHPFKFEAFYLLPFLCFPLLLKAATGATISQLEYIRERLLNVMGQDQHRLIAIFHYHLDKSRGTISNNSNSNDYAFDRERDDYYREAPLAKSLPSYSPPRSRQLSPPKMRNDYAKDYSKNGEIGNLSRNENISINLALSDHDVLLFKLKRIGLDMYLAAMEANGYRNWDQLCKLTENEMILMMDRCRFTTLHRIQLLLDLASANLG